MHFLSSVIVSSGATLLVLLIGTPAACGLAQFEFPIRSKHLNFWFFSQRVMPPVVLLAPFFILLVRFRLVDTWLGLILIYTTFNLSFGIVILRDVFREIGRDISDAAKVDGANTWQIFWLIAIPLCLEGLTATGIIVFSFCWNEALFAAAVAPEHDVHPCLARHPGGQFQHRRSQYPDRNHAAGPDVFVRVSLSGRRINLRRGERLTYLDRYVTDEQRSSRPIFSATPVGRGRLAVFPRCSLDRYDPDGGASLAP